MESIHDALIPRLDKVSKAVASHWPLVNRVLPPLKPLILMAETEFLQFETLVAYHNATRTALQAAVWAETLPREERRELQERLRLGWRAFARRVRAEYPLTYWPRVVPLVPQTRSEPWDFWSGLTAVIALWQKMIAEGDDPAQFPSADPTTLSLAEMQAAAATLPTALRHAMKLDRATFLARLDLDDAQAQLATALLAYPPAVASRLPANHRLRASIPQIWPKPRPKKPPSTS